MHVAIRDRVRAGDRGGDVLRVVEAGAERECVRVGVLRGVYCVRGCCGLLARVVYA